MVVSYYWFHIHFPYTDLQDKCLHVIGHFSQLQVSFCFDKNFIYAYEK